VSKATPSARLLEFHEDYQCRRAGKLVIRGQKAKSKPKAGMTLRKLIVFSWGWQDRI
jgi:hypothetical protein